MQINEQTKLEESIELAKRLIEICRKNQRKSSVVYGLFYETISNLNENIKIFEEKLENLVKSA